MMPQPPSQPDRGPKARVAQLKVVPDASHSALAEQPDLYRSLLREYLHSIESR